MDKKNAAKILFYKGNTFKDIASILNLNEKTVSSWAHKYKWKDDKDKKDLFRQTNEERILSLINHNLIVLEKISIIQANTIENCNDIKELEKALTKKGDIDALSKLFSAIKGKELDFEKVIDICREIIEYLEDDPELSQKIIPYINQFINDKRNKL